MGQCSSHSNYHRKNRLITKDVYAGNKSSHNLKTPRTTITQQRDHPISPTSIIIPEITEHVNNSCSSSDDDELDFLISLQQPPNSLSSEDRHPMAEHVDSVSTTLASTTGSYRTANGYTKRSNNISTSLITVQRERLRSVKSPASSSTSHNKPPNEDIVYSSDDGITTQSGSPAVLRRLIAQTKSKLRSTGRLLHEQPTTSFSQVHESLTKSIIIEEGEVPLGSTGTSKTAPKYCNGTTSSSNGGTAHLDSEAAPSDEENEPASDDDSRSFIKSKSLSYLYIEPDPALPSLSRRRKLKQNVTSTAIIITPGSAKRSVAASNSKNINHKLQRIGPLSPVKLKTSHCVSPQSIRVYDDNENDIPAITTITTSLVRKKSDAVTQTNSDIVTTAPGDENEIAAIDTRTIQNFTKLKLQIQVAARQAQKQRQIHKVEDRINDVQQHRQLWNEFQLIQDNISTTDNNDHEMDFASTELPLVSTDDEMHSISQPEVGEQCAVKESNVSNLTLPNTTMNRVRRLRRRKPRRFLQKENRINNKDERVESSSSVVPSIAVEYELEDDVPVIAKKKNSPQRRLNMHQKSKSSPNVTIETAPDAVIGSESVVNIIPSSPARKSLVRSNSFDLHQTNTWFVDFQEEFDAVPNHEIPTTTQSMIINNSPMGTKNNASSNNSQADLSLLSANSLDIQRRLYAEKRRQRKKSTISCTNVDTATTTPGEPISTTPMHETPVARNGTNRGYFRCTGSSYGTVSSNDYGPSSKGRPPLSLSGLRSMSVGGGSAQELYNAPNEAEKLRIAKEILRRRVVTNMEVTFTTPKQSRKITSAISGIENGDNSEIDNSSFISDLDESYTSHHTYRSNQSTTNNDYGPQRRPARRNNNRSARDGDTEDQSSILSDVSFDLSQKMDNNQSNLIVDSGSMKNDNSVQTKISDSTYDFQLIVQRRLDIEERLRALMSSDDLETQTWPSSNSLKDEKTVNESVASVTAVVDGTSIISQPPVTSTPENICPEKRNKSGSLNFEYGDNPLLMNEQTKDRDYCIVSPDNESDPVPTVTQATPKYYSLQKSLNEASVVTPNADDIPSHQRKLDSRQYKGRSDFSRLLDAVEVTRPRGIHDVTTDATDLQEFTFFSHTSINEKIVSDNSGKSETIIEAVEDDNGDRILGNDPSFAFPVTANLATTLSVINESYESSESSSNTMKLPIHYIHDRTSDDRSINSRFDSTNQTLMLADQVEANVNDILKRYRHYDDSTPQCVSTGTINEQESSPNMTTLHIIKNSPS